MFRSISLPLLLAVPLTACVESELEPATEAAALGQPPLTYISTAPRDAWNNGLLERVAPANLPQVSYLTNVDMTFRNDSTSPRFLSSLDVTFEGTGQPTQHWTLDELVDLNDDDYTFIDGRSWNLGGAKWLDKVDGVLHGAWTDVVANNGWYAVGTVTDPVDRMVVAALGADGAPGTVRRLFAAQAATPAGLKALGNWLWIGGAVTDALGNTRFASTQVDVNTGLAPVAAYGERTYAVLGCTVTGATDTWLGTVETRAGSMVVPALRFFISGSMRCGSVDYGAVVSVRPDGTLDPSFGTLGVARLQAPGSTSTRATALTGVLDERGKRRLVVALERGTVTGCGAQSPTNAAACASWLVRLDELGGLTQGFGALGFARVGYAGTGADGVEALITDADGGLLAAGWEIVGTPAGNRRHWAVARHLAGGALDVAWSQGGGGGGGFDCGVTCGGHEVVLPSGREGAILDLALADDRILAGGWLAVGGARDMGAGHLDLAGHFVIADHGFHHWQPSASPAEVRAVLGDSSGRAVGFGLGIDAHWGSARWLTGGQLDRVEVLEPGEEVIVRQPDGTLQTVQPTALTLALHVEGFAEPAMHTAPLVVFESLMPGGYDLPFRDLPADLNMYVDDTHETGSHHRENSGQRFAYDIKAERWTGTEWTGFAAGGTDKYKNSHLAAYGVSVYAMADGLVVRCYRDYAENVMPDQDAAVFTATGGGGNSVLIYHPNTAEYALYAHLQPEVAEAVCPVGSDGLLAVQLPVSRGDYLGLVGNSGHSTAPHLHVHIQRHHPDFDGKADDGVPLHFSTGHIRASSAPLGSPWTPLDATALAPYSHFR